nr:hypothetical protein [Tanacetum cinerariifolium]
MVIVEWKIRDYEDPVDEQEAYKWKIRDYEDPVDEQEAYTLGNDADVMNLGRYIDKYRLIEVFIEHEYTVLETYWNSSQKLRLEEIDDVESIALARKPPQH